MTQDRIQGKVAAILNRRELVMTVGSDNGVRKGMKFAVLNPIGLDIRDPDSGESLGTVEMHKVLVEVVRVQEKVSVGRTFKTVRRNIGGMGSIGLDVESIFKPRRIVEVPETLEVAAKPHAEELSEEDSLVKVGDPVVQVADDEFD